MKPEILLVDPMMDPIEKQLDAHYTVHRLSKAADRAALLREHGPNIRGVVTGGGSGISNEMADQLPKLEIVAINGIGTDAVDLERQRQHKVRVTTTPDVLTDDVADLGMALLLAAARSLVVGDRFVRDGRWAKKHGMPLAVKVSGKRLGILGLGRIGRAIAQRGKGFGMHVSYHDIRAFDDVEHRHVGDLVTLAREVDFLLVAASGGPASRGIVNAAVLEALGPEGILVNIARGSVVDEPALVAALQQNKLGGAGLDVFADEPNVPHALFAMENVVLQPHRASATVETRIAMGELVLRNLAEHFAGREPPTAVV